METPGHGVVIQAPADRPGEVEQLARAGAGEVYGGIQHLGPGRLSVTRRTFASAHFPDEGALREAVTEAGTHGIGFLVTLNATRYDPGLHGRLVAFAERAAGWGARGFIVSDPGLLKRLRPAVPRAQIVLSTLAGGLNRHAVAFYKRFGVDRVVFPRHLTLGEMASIRRAHPALAFEAFVLVGRCPNEEAFCTFQHVSPSGRWPCEIPYRLKQPDGRAVPGSHPLARWHALWRRADRRLGCGVCAVPELARMGVGYLKIVGRGGPTRAKVENVRMVARFVRGELGPGDGPRAYRERFGRACGPLVCYFPELFPGQGKADPSAHPEDGQEGGVV